MKNSVIDTIIENLPSALLAGNFNHSIIKDVKETLHEESVTRSYVTDLYHLKACLTASCGIDSEVVDKVIMDAIQLTISKNQIITNPDSIPVENKKEFLGTTPAPDHYSYAGM